MSGFHDQQPGARSHALPAGGHTSSGAFDAPGKRTLTQGLGAARGSGPIQLQSDGGRHPIPDTAFVAQYGPRSDADRKNDCGPSCILMALRAMGVEHLLVERMPAEYRPLTDQNKVKYICYVGFGDPDSQPRHLDQIQSCLITVLGALGVPVPEPEKMFQLLSPTTPPGKPQYSPELAGVFIQQHCGDGSAVMILGNAVGGPWGWGGMLDTGNTHRVEDQGNHIVLVWRPDQSQDRYTVMDPSWTAPLTGKSLADVVGFMTARGPGSIMNVMAVPYEKVAELAPAIPTRPPGRSPSILPRRGDAAAAPVEDAGAGAALPEPTRFKLQDLFGTDLSAVRVHQGGAAPAVGALAYAQGDDVHFAPGRFQPGTPDGDRLIGHEVAHVVQQREGRVAAPQQHKGAVVADAALEAEADAFGDRAARGEVTGGPVRVAQAATGDRTAAPVQRLVGGGGGPASGGGDDLAGKLQAVADAYLHVSPVPTEASGQTQYGQAVLDLWTWCKLNLPAPAELDPYLHGPVASDKKRETIGRMAVRRARLEFLLGWLLQGGIHSNGKNWETGPGTNATTGSDGQVTDQTANAGPIVSQYESGANDAGNKIDYGASNQDWCGMFVGFCLGRLGMAETWGGDFSDHSELESAYRADHRIAGKLKAVQNGGSLGTGEVIISPDMLPVAAAPGSPPVQGPAGPPPQAGDVVVFAHHIAMVESYDPAALQITTIDGNVGLQSHDASNSVSGYRYTTQELKDAHGGLRFIWRPSLEAFGATITGTSADNTAGDTLVQHLDDACNQVTALYQQLRLPGAPAGGQAVADIAAASVQPSGAQPSTAPKRSSAKPGTGPQPTK